LVLGQYPGTKQRLDKLREGASVEDIEKFLEAVFGSNAVSGNGTGCSYTFKLYAGKYSLWLSQDPRGKPDLQGADLVDAIRRLEGIPAKDSESPTGPPAGQDHGVDVELGLLREDGGTQPRAQLDEETVDKYAEAMAEGGATFPPVVAFYDGESYWLAGGYHRKAAARRIGMSVLRTEVKQGTRRDALRYSLGTNAEHGLPRSNADKLRAVRTALDDEEWSKLGNHDIARLCAVTAQYVGIIRQQLTGSRSPSHITVTRAGKSFQMHTTKIGRRDRKASDGPASAPRALDSCGTAQAPSSDSKTGSGVDLDGLPGSGQAAAASPDIATALPGLCRVCGCTNTNPCVVGEVPCTWVADSNRTLCSNCQSMMDSRGLSEERLRKLLGNDQVPEAHVAESIGAEPSPVVDEAEVLYRRSLITITIQLFPHEGDFGERPVLVIASNDNESPMNRMGKGSDLGSFTGLVLSTLHALKAELPEREAARRAEKAKETSRKAGKRTSKSSRGRSVAKETASSLEPSSGNKSVASGTVGSKKGARNSWNPNSPKQSSPAGPAAATEHASADQQMSTEGGS
jgi:hypothetical protein